MGQVVLLLCDASATVDIGPDVAQRLADLGVTSLAVVRDAATTAIVVEGWAFDAEGSGEVAAHAIVGGLSAVRILRPVLDTAIHAAGWQSAGRGSGG